MENNNKRIYITESLCYTPETNTILCINCTLIKKKKSCGTSSIPWEKRRRGGNRQQGAAVLAPAVLLMLCGFSQVPSLSVLVLIYTTWGREDA